MLYPLVELPFDIPFKKMKKDELAKYNEWFFEVKPFRLDILVKALNLPKEKMYSVDSLNCLGEWLCDEIRGMIKKMDYTGFASISFDAGLYLGELIIKNHDGTFWAQKLGGRSFNNFGRVSIRNFFSYDDFDVIGFAFRVELGMRDGEDSENVFVEYYNKWIKRLNESVKLGIGD